MSGPYRENAVGVFRVVESDIGEPLPKNLYTVELQKKGTTASYSKDYFTILANTHEEVLHVIKTELRYEDDAILEITKTASIYEGIASIAYKKR